MKSIQTKFIILILGCVLLCSTVIGGAGILSAKKVVEADSAQILNLLCDQKSSEMDAQLLRIEQSVKTLSVYAQSQLESVNRLKTDPNYVSQYTALLEPVAINAARNTEGALAVYVRYNPTFTPPTSGLFWSKTDRDGSFQRLTPTDFSIYSPTDIERVGWYYTPVKAGKPIWMLPYNNQNLNVRMISYVIPLYMNNETIGVVGMDIDFSVVEKLINNIRIYQHGYAFLTDETSTIMYHKNIPFATPLNSIAQFNTLSSELTNSTSGSSLFSYIRDGQEQRLAFRSLRNGMRLAVTAPVSEIDSEKNSLIRQIIIYMIVISSISVFLTVLFTKKIVRPLRELNEAAKKIAAGDLSISITKQTQDEIGTLTDSFQQTVSHLQKYITYINGLAYRDSLTGVKNKTAYLEAERKMDERMRSGRPEFAIMVLDINELKFINDNFGHDFGDMIIIDACRLICRVFKHSPVYRIGGDEFVVILENVDLKNYQELLAKFQVELTEHNKNSRPSGHLSIARGIAIYQNETDLVFANVFKRADDAMYQNKTERKRAEKIDEGNEDH